jgi:hypothetical protein
MPTLVSHISEIAYAELLPDGSMLLAELDLDVDLQDVVDLHVPESECEIALPGCW